MVVFAVTLGNLLEWYEIYLYVYWAPIISRLFFNSTSDLVNLTNTFLIFGMGFLARPLGGIFFGRIGDLLGRKKSLILSITMMIIPTFVTGFLPGQAAIGFMAPVILGIMRILQSFPAGGELPGAFCYLYETSHLRHRRFMCSWGAFGFQVGILIATLECFLLERYLNPQALLEWGWRLSFIIGGLIGIVGLYLRYKLHETPLYREMLTHEQVVKESIPTVLTKHKKGIFMGILFCSLNSSAFYLLTVNFPVYFGEVLGTSYANNLMLTTILLLLITIPLPFYGKLADHYSNKRLLVGSTLGIIALLAPLYFAIVYKSLLFMGIIIIIFSQFFTMLSTLIPYILADQFVTRVRFTCVGLSFNLADAIIGGFTPVAALYLLNKTENEASFCWFLTFFAVVSLVAFALMKERHPAETFSSNQSDHHKHQ